MKHINDDKQMTDVWRLPAIAPWEKHCGKHPTQKPLGVLSRIILASTEPGAWILDPFAGSSTTGIAANLLGRRFLGIEREEDFAAMSKARRQEIDKLSTFAEYRHKISDIVKAEVDYKTAMRATAGQSRSDAEKDLQGAAMRLENLGVPESVIKALNASKSAMPMKIDWPSPVSGVVIDKKVIEGQKVSAGAMLYQIADLSSIWVIADVAEQDIPDRSSKSYTDFIAAFSGNKRRCA